MKVAIIILCIMLGVAGLFISACGGILIFLGLGNGGSIAATVLILVASLALLVAGFAVSRPAAFRNSMRLWKRGDPLGNGSGQHRPAHRIAREYPMKKSIIVLLCIETGLIGLFMSACGGFFTLVSLFQFRGDMGILAIALPSLLVGMLCLWGAIAGIRKATRTPAVKPTDP